MFIIFMSSDGLTLYHYKYPSLSLITVLVLKSILSDSEIATLTLLGIVCKVPLLPFLYFKPVYVFESKVCFL